MDITLSSANLPQLKARIADNEARGWHVVSGITREEKETKQFSRGGMYGQYCAYEQHAHATKYMVRMRREEKMEVAQ